MFEVDVQNVTEEKGRRRGPGLVWNMDDIIWAHCVILNEGEWGGSGIFVYILLQKVE